MKCWNIAEVIELICDTTKEGPVSQWVDRIGVIAAKAGMDLSDICWQGAPKTVAFNLYEEAKRRDKVAQLIETCNLTVR